MYDESIMNEPVQTQPNPAGTGRPVISDEQYAKWLDDMRPFLRQGSTLWYAMDKCNLLMYKDSIYEKYRRKDWFSERVDALRSIVGEMINNVGFRIVETIHNRIIESDGKVHILSSEELQVWKTMAEKHRSAQAFFVTRTEEAKADDTKLGKIIETLDNGTDYDDVAREAEKQMVASDAPVQDQGQAGANSDVQAKLDAAQAHSPETQPPAQPNT